MQGYSVQLAFCLLVIKIYSVCLLRTSLKEQHETVSSTLIKLNLQGFPGGAVVKNTPANAGDMGLSPGPGRSHMPRSN